LPLLGEFRLKAMALTPVSMMGQAAFGGSGFLAKRRIG
jgi:hypothetical protein